MESKARTGRQAEPERKWEEQSQGKLRGRKRSRKARDGEKGSERDLPGERESGERGLAGETGSRSQPRAAPPHPTPMPTTEAFHSRT